MNFPALESVWSSAWAPPKKYLPSEWAEDHFVLPEKGNAEPGKFRFARTPYLIGIVNAIVEPGVEDVVFLKPTRVGGTTAGQVILGYWIDNDPGNCLTVMPSEAAAEEEVKDHIRPLLECPSLKSHVSADPHKNTLSRIELDTMDLYNGWAGSPQSLAMKTCRYVRFDEVDKYPPFAGRESDPISLGKERTGSYGHRKRHYITSTPTTRDGAITKQFEACGDKRYFHVPCPHCSAYQRLTWPQVKWPKQLTDEDGNAITDKIALADRIEQGRLAYYECSHCKGKIEDYHKPKMLERGAALAQYGWISEGQTVSPDGRVMGRRPGSKRIGFHLSSLYSPWRTFSDMASEFIRAEGDIAAAMNFRNSRLAEPFEQQVAKTEASEIRKKATNAPPRLIVPDWAQALVATADTQTNSFYWVVRAWGFEFRSQLIEFGIAYTFEELANSTIRKTFKRKDGTSGSPQMLLIDSGGNRTNEVYDFALTDRTRIKPIKGASRRLQWPVNKSLQRAHGIELWSIDTVQCKDRLASLVGDADATRWQVNDGVNEDYVRQLSSEHKVINPQTKYAEWKLKTSGSANHYLDCEVYQIAGAVELGAGNPAPAAVPPATVSPESDPYNPLARSRRW